jgi:ABC-type branched-subunit amino acid transport system substrate-binding protein
MRKITIYLSLLLSLALVATACVSEAEETTTTAAASTPTETTEAQAPTTTAPATTDTTEGTVEPADPVLIGSIHPLTGGLAGAGNRMDNGARMAVEEINAAGGIASLGGAPLELLSADSTGAAEVGQSEAERLIGDGVSAIIGTYQSAVTTNVAAIAERDGVPLVIDVAVADSILDQGYTNVFRIQPNATSMGASGAQFLSELAGDEIKTVSYLHDDTGFGVSVADAFEAAAADYGIEVVARIPYPPFEVTDLTTEMSQAAAASPDVIVITGYYNDGLLAARAATDLEVATLLSSLPISEQMPSCSSTRTTTSTPRTPRSRVSWSGSRLRTVNRWTRKQCSRIRPSMSSQMRWNAPVLLIPPTYGRRLPRPTSPITTWHIPVRSRSTKQVRT